jgi:putative transposase
MTLQEYNTIIGKLLSGIDRRKFKHLVDKYNGDFACKKLTCWEQFVAVFLGQITNCSSLRDIVEFIKFHSKEQYHLGIKKDIARTTLAKANETRDWRIYRDLFLSLINKFKTEKFQEARELVEIIDSTAIALKFEQHKWAQKNNVFRGIKTHVVFNLTEKMPTYFTFSPANVSDIKEAHKLKIKKDCTYVLDRGYLDFNWLKKINDKGAYFVTRLKKNSAITALSDLQVTNEKISSQIIEFSRKWNNRGILNTYHKKPIKKVIVQREGKSPLILITNDFKRSDEEIAELYKQRWQIELFFKWIKQNLKIKKFLGRSENAIKTQICIAMISFVLLRLANELKGMCEQIPTKILLKIIGNNLFKRLKLIDNGRKRWQNPNQLQFQWSLSP